MIYSNNKNISNDQLIECVATNLNALKRADCANELGNLNYGKTETIILAINYYLIAYKINPKNSTYIHNLSKVYYFVEDFDKAEPYLITCTDIELSDFEKSICAAKLSTIYYNKNNYTQSIKYLKLAQNIEPTNPSYSQALAYQYNEIKKYKLAEKYLKKCIHSNSTEINDKHIIANCATKLGDLYLTNNISASEASFYHYLAYQLFPQNYNLLNKTILSFLRYKNYNMAKELLIACINNESDFSNSSKAECANRLGNIFMTGRYISLDNTNNASKAYTLAIELDNSNPIYNYNKALLLFSNNTDPVVTSSLLSICLESNYTELFTNVEKSKCANKLATLYFNGQLKEISPKATADKIIHYYKLAYELYQEKNYLYNLGYSYFLAGKYKEAGPILAECKENIDNSYNSFMQNACHDMYLDILGRYINNSFDL